MVNFKSSVLLKTRNFHKHVYFITLAWIVFLLFVELFCLFDNGVFKHWCSIVKCITSVNIMIDCLPARFCVVKKYIQTFSPTV